MIKYILIEINEDSFYDLNYNKMEFMKDYTTNFNWWEWFAKSLSIDSFKQSDYILITSNSALRKVYDNYLDIVNWPWDDSFKEIKIEIWFAKIAYQESRKVQWKSILPQWFMKFLRLIFEKLSKNQSKFKDFLEVFVSYHKYFNPQAK